MTLRDSPTSTKDDCGLAIRQLCAWYQTSGENERPVFWGVSLDVPRGQILGVVGPNGSGKSTLMRAVCGLHPLRTGEVRISGQSASSQRIGVVPQAYAESFFPWATLRTNISMLGGSAARIDALLSDFRIKLDLDLRPPQCSGGMIQQAAVLRALATAPAFLVADEPFSALDMNVASNIRQALRVHVKREGIPAVVVSHDLLSIVELCDKVLVIPGTPYTTATIPGYEAARLIENENVATFATSASASSGFLDTVSRLLQRPHQ